MSRPIIAVDFTEKAELLDFLAKFPQEESLFLKVGMSLFYKYGPQLIHELRERNHDIFLDLKFHDIPNTVKNALIAIANLDVALTTLHAAGGTKMLQEAVNIKAQLNMRTKLFAVTQLTSVSEQEMQQDQLTTVSLIDSVKHYASLAAKTGIDGVVSSAHEIQTIKSLYKNLQCLTPGIRLATDEIGDQKRVVTPDMAKQLGSDFIVVGRPIIKSATPYEAYQHINSLYND